MNISKVTIEGRKAPIGIDVKNPSFAWNAKNCEGKVQSAYQMQVAKDKLFTTVVYDTGNVNSDEQTHILYQGEALSAKTRYFVRVRIWDERGDASAYSEPAFFETGLMEEGFLSSWIEPLQEEAFAEPECMHIGQVFMPRETVPITERLRPSQYIRKTFETKADIVSARFYATSHGIYEFYINGQKGSARYFAPEISSYQERQFYQTYDVTPYLQEGKNALGVVLADGWHIGRIGLSGDSCQYESKLAFLGQLEITYKNGEKMIIGTDDTFVSHTGKHVYADLFMGEMHDMRLDEQHFFESHYIDDGWKPVSVIEAKKSHLIGQSKEPIQAIAKLAPVQLLITPSGEQVVDFGKVLAGFVVMKASGAPGTKITLEFCEELDKDGNFFNHIAGRNNDQLDGIVLSGNGEELFEPSFTYHGFRYVKVSGYPGVLELSKLSAIVLGTTLEKTLDFSTSNPLLNQLQANIFNSQQGNMISIPTDCPQREKSGFTGDIQVYGVTGCYNMDLEYFLKDWLGDVRIEQCENGEVPNIAPNYPKMKTLQQRTNGCQSSAGWGDACVLVPWILYEQYGNKAVLDENFETMAKWLSYIEGEAPDYIWENENHFGDWLIPSLTKFGMNIDPSLSDIRSIVATCYFKQSAMLTGKIAGVLKKEIEASYYTTLAEKIKEAFCARFVREDRLSMDYQGMLVLALAMDMVSPVQAPALAKHLHELVCENGYRLDTGFMSVRYLLAVLVQYGYKDTARTLLYQEACPSWLYQVKQGATSIWEKWDAKMPDGTVNTVSFNHYSFGCVGEFMYQSIAGLKPKKAGFKEFEIRPDFSFGLDDLHLIYQSSYGQLTIGWEKQENESLKLIQQKTGACVEQYALTMQVPFNTTCVLYVNGQVHRLQAGQHTYLCQYNGHIDKINAAVIE